MTYKVRNISLEVEYNINDWSLVSYIENTLKKEWYPIRWAIVSWKKIWNWSYVYSIESTVIHWFSSKFSHEEVISKDIHNNIFVHIVPTWIQASIWWSLWDAMPINTVLGSLWTLVTHPNVCNAWPILVWGRNDFLYVEWSALDSWASWKCNLNPNQETKIWVIIDGSVKETTMWNRAVNAVQWFWAHTWTPIVWYEFTNNEILPKVTVTQSGACVWEVGNIQTILDAAQVLIDRWANRIAVFTYVDTPKDYRTEYFDWNFPNPVWWVESIISHSITQNFWIVSAHGPLVDEEEEKMLWESGIVTPAAWLESANPFYPLCVLRGLMDAPGLTTRDEGISFLNTTVVFVPATALWWVSVLKAIEKSVPIFAIEENTTIMSCSSIIFSSNSIFVLKSYLIGIWMILESQKRWDSSIITMRSIFESVSHDQLENKASMYVSSLNIDPSSLSSKQSKLWQ